MHEIDNILQNMQRAIDSWEGNIKITEGAIRLNKSFTYSISFRFDKTGKYWFESIEEINSSLAVVNEIGVRENL